MKVLITGAAGFIGSHTMEEFASQGHDVVGLDNFNDNYDVIQKLKNVEELNKKGLRIIRADIRDHHTPDVIAKEKPDVIVHLAAVPGVRQSIENPAYYVSVNALGTQYIIDAARRTNATLIVASSSSVYGDRDKVPFKEDELGHEPISPYAATKQAAELLAYTHHHLTGLPVTCLRFFTVYGPRGRPDMAPYLFMDAIYHGKELTQYGKGDTLRDYTYVKDIAQGILLAAEKAKGYNVYNLGAGSPVKLADFIATIEKVVGKKAIIKEKPRHPGDVRVTYADISRARKDLGYAPKTQYEEGVKKQYDWFVQYLKQKGTLEHDVFEKI